MATTDVNPASEPKVPEQPAVANGKNKGEFYKHPDSKTLQEAGELKLKDEEGNELLFKSLYTDQPGRQLIIFLRHFFCGTCEDYVRAVVASLTPTVLAASSPPTTLTFIGCGEPACIAGYRERTMGHLGDTAFTIYCDPSRALYTKLGMVVTLRQADKKPEFLTRSLPSVILGSIMNAVKSGTAALKGGPAAQNGGEMLFQKEELVWFHRMNNTTDHAEVNELKEVLGFRSVHVCDAPLAEDKIAQ